MKRTLRIAGLLFFLGATFSAQSQKKTQNFKVAKVLPFSAEKVWAVVGEDYGRIAHSHPRIVSSDYINGTLKAGEGAERVCYFNDKQTQYLKEKMVDYAPDQMQFTNTVFKVAKFPVDPEYTKAIYKVKDLGNGSSELSFNMTYRTKPAWMGSMAKGKFKKLINNYFIAIQHHIKTGEEVTRDNFKEIKKLYAKNTEKTELVAIALAQAHY